MATKLLLIEDVEELGRSGDIVSVRPGYARNFLLPQGIAVNATAHALRMQARLQEERNQKAIHDKKEAEEVAARFEGAILSITVKVDQEGHMYGSVSALDIAHLIKEQLGLAIEKRMVQLKHPIKETGAYTINLKLNEGVVASFNLKVIAEEIPGAIVTSSKEATAADESNEEKSEGRRKRSKKEKGE